MTSRDGKPDDLEEGGPYDKVRSPYRNAAAVASPSSTSSIHMRHRSPKPHGTTARIDGGATAEDGLESKPILAQPNLSSTEAGNSDEVHPGPSGESMAAVRSVTWKRLSWWGSGIREDVKRRLPWYVSDWQDGLYFGVLAAGLLMFFAQAAPGMSFGEAMAERTEGQLGVVEALLATGICSIIYAVLAGQPLVIVGLTGPSTVLYGTVYLLAKQFDIDFLPWMFWVCLWCCLIMTVLAVANASDLVVFVTRFTAEGFEVLVAVTYLTEAVRGLVHISQDGSLSNLLGSLLLAVAVLYVTMTLHDARTWPYFSPVFRELLASYGVTLAVVAATGLSYIPMFTDADIVRLSVPSTYDWQPTGGRSWIVPFWDVAVGPIMAAIVPGALMAVLYFFDTSVSAILTQQHEFGLKKGPSYHYDLVIQGVLVLVAGLLGLPAVNGLLPQSPLHVRALADIKYIHLPNGQRKEVYTYVHETRLAATLHAALFFLTLGFIQVPATIPKGVFVGLFLYLGFSTFRDNSLVDRLKLLLVEKELRADHWTLLEGVPYDVTVKFTLCQAFLVLVTYVVGEHSGAAGVIFPLLVVLMIPFRWRVLPRFLPGNYLAILDGSFLEPSNRSAAVAGPSSLSPTPAVPPLEAEFLSTDARNITHHQGQHHHSEANVGHMKSPALHDGNFNRSRLISGDWIEPLIEADYPSLAAAGASWNSGAGIPSPKAKIAVKKSAV